MSRLLTLAAFVAGFVSSVFSLPEACTGTCTNTHDPSIIVRTDGTYFRFSTGGRIAIHSASNITGPWKYRGAALPNDSSINLRGNQDLWAPDVSFLNGTYYLYYAVSTFGSQTSAIGVARSANLEPGSWTDLGSTGISSDSRKPYNAIDPNLIITNRTRFLTFGSFWNGLYQIPMGSPPVRAADSVSTPRQISYDKSDKAEEGPVVFENEGHFYLFFSRGACCGYDKDRPARGKEYRIVVCRSDSPSGGFVDQSGVACTSGGGTVVLGSHKWVYGPGGQGVYRDAVLGPILYYHYVDTRVGYADGQKRFGWNKLDFSTGWPAVVPVSST
ncbi:putative arabinan endo-1,5-alpha-L-arabinosidase A [Echria macrotheca]|uniref:Arabinan endo-1,5-alpha-L-arabinosidase n=1 Tax=Echria macrotheca TaxID=438768 RepID=A0AAJ0F6T1_9PEZI|nr:putative arabinan endo-1,5-alpha-L-arabinosidase A [Echria macrotheca]